MVKAPIPENETQRLMALHALNTLDTPPEARFDRITRLAKRLFDVPIVAVSLVDSDRQWFKSCQGLSVNQTPRDISFCGHAILSGQDIYLIPNALEDERFADNPLVVEDPKIRFYAGASLAAPDGHLIGTLCIIDTKPRTFSETQTHLLRDLADIVEGELIQVEIGELQREIRERERAEALAIEQSDRREALLEIGRAVQEMVDPDSLFEVMQTCLASVRKIGLEAETMGIHRMVDPAKRMVESYRVDMAGAIGRPECRKSTALTESWEQGTVKLERNFNTEDPTVVARLRKRFGKKISRVTSTYRLGRGSFRCRA